MWYERRSGSDGPHVPTPRALSSPLPVRVRIARVDSFEQVRQPLLVVGGGQHPDLEVAREEGVTLEGLAGRAVREELRGYLVAGEAVDRAQLDKAGRIALDQSVRRECRAFAEGGVVDGTAGRGEPRGVWRSRRLRTTSAGRNREHGDQEEKGSHVVWYTACSANVPQRLGEESNDAGGMASVRVPVRVEVGHAGPNEARIVAKWPQKLFELVPVEPARLSVRDGGERLLVEDVQVHMEPDRVGLRGQLERAPDDCGRAEVSHLAGGEPLNAVIDEVDLLRGVALVLVAVSDREHVLGFEERNPLAQADQGLGAVAEEDAQLHVGSFPRRRSRAVVRVEVAVDEPEPGTAMVALERREDPEQNRAVTPQDKRALSVPEEPVNTLPQLLRGALEIGEADDAGLGIAACVVDPPSNVALVRGLESSDEPCFAKHCGHPGLPVRYPL
jgi:hypothetical protein